MPLLSSRHLRNFLAVAERLNFRAAARDLNLAQPALSRSIATLESDLEVRLFERGTRHVALTPAGEVLLREGRAALAQLERADTLTRIAAAGGAGTLRVGYGVFASMGPMSRLIMDFRGRYPEARVRLRTLATTEQLEALERGEIDVGFAFSVACPPPWRSLMVSREEFVVLASAVHPLATAPGVRLAELAGHDFVLGTMERWRPFRALINALCMSAGFLPNVVEEADDLPILMAMLTSGAGIALHGAAILSSLPPGIVAIPLLDESATVDISLVWSAADNSPLTANFVAVARELIGPHPRHIGLEAPHRSGPAI